MGSRDQKYGGKVKVNLKVKVPSFKGLPSESNIKVKMRMQASERQNVIHHQIGLVRTRPEVWTLKIGAFTEVSENENGWKRISNCLLSK